MEARSCDLSLCWWAGTSCIALSVYQYQQSMEHQRGSECLGKPLSIGAGMWVSQLGTARDVACSEAQLLLSLKESCSTPTGFRNLHDGAVIIYHTRPVSPASDFTILRGQKATAIIWAGSFCWVSFFLFLSWSCAETALGHLHGAVTPKPRYHQP